MIIFKHTSQEIWLDAKCTSHGWLSKIQSHLCVVWGSLHALYIIPLWFYVHANCHMQHTIFKYIKSAALPHYSATLLFLEPHPITVCIHNGSHAFLSICRYAWSMLFAGLCKTTPTNQSLLCESQSMVTL